MRLYNGLYVLVLTECARTSCVLLNFGKGICRITQDNSVVGQKIDCTFGKCVGSAKTIQSQPYLAARYEAVTLNEAVYVAKFRKCRDLNTIKVTFILLRGCVHLFNGRKLHFSLFRNYTKRSVESKHENKYVLFKAL